MSRLWPEPPWRPLPHPVSPIARETIYSYLARLAEANRLDAEALRAYIAGDHRKSAPIPVDVLARVSGQSERSLRYAIPGLSTAAKPAGLHLDNQPGPHGLPRPACRLCTASRGHTSGPMPWCRANPESAVCRKHLRWLGDCVDHASLGQPDLTGHPVIVHANQVHRKLAARHGGAADAYRLAHDICHTWRDRCERQEQLTELIDALRPDKSSFAFNDPAVHAARYPQIVAVSQLLITPGWRTKAHEQWDRPEQLIRDVVRAVTPSPRWTLEQNELLIEALLDDDTVKTRPGRARQARLSFDDLTQLDGTPQHDSVPPR